MNYHGHDDDDDDDRCSLSLSLSFMDRFEYFTHVVGFNEILRLWKDEYGEAVDPVFSGATDLSSQKP